MDVNDQMMLERRESDSADLFSENRSLKENCLRLIKEIDKHPIQTQICDTNICYHVDILKGLL